MNDHYIQKQQYNEYMNELENLSNINYNHSFENGSLSERYPACLTISYMGCQYKINVGYGFLAGWFTKNDYHAMSSAFLSPIGERPTEPEEADEELDADQLHKMKNRIIIDVDLYRCNVVIPYTSS
jgi:hypothetical protein